MSRTQKTKGISLAKGPVGLIGLGLLTFGIVAVIFGGHNFGQHAPSGAVHGKIWLGLELNGWSDVLFIAAGLLLLLSAPLHWAAKGMSLIVGLALAAGALVALVKGHGVLGIFAANHLTELVWGAIAVLLIVLSLLPRVRAKSKQRQDPRRVERYVELEPPTTVEHDPALAETGPVARESLQGDGARANPRFVPAVSTPESYAQAGASHSLNGSATPAAALERPGSATSLPSNNQPHRKGAPHD